MKELKVKITFTEGVLGTLPADTEIYSTYIASQAPDAKTMEEEVAIRGVLDVIEKQTTIFPKTEDGQPFLFDYQIRGFFKDTCSALRRVKSDKNESSKMKAFKKIIDGLIFVEPRQCILDLPPDTEISICQRPLRINGPAGELTALSSSEELPAGTTCAFIILCLEDSHENAVKEWLNYGRLRGIGQWRNASKGRFRWEELDEEGNIIGGNKK
jgi:hypothetical protein